MVHGSRRADPGSAREDACERSTGAVPRGHAEGTPHALGTSAARQTLAHRAPRRAGEAARAGRRALRVRREPRSGGQGALDAPPATEVAVGAAEATEHHEPTARCTADEARRRADETARRVALDR